MVTDNGPAFKGIALGGFIASRAELAHVRTRHHTPKTNGAVGRFNDPLKYEHLYRLEIRDVIELAAEIAPYRDLSNPVRPHEALGFATPLSRHLWPPEPHPFQTESVQ